MVEDFQFVKAPKPPTQQRRSMLRALIANPRYSTFQQIGGANFNDVGVGAGAVGQPKAADVVPPELRATRITPSLVMAPTSRITATTIANLQGIPRPPQAFTAERSRPTTFGTVATSSGMSQQVPFTATTLGTDFLTPSARLPFQALGQAITGSPSHTPVTPEPVFGPQQRVTVSISRDRRPTLVLRPVSDLDVPEHMKTAHSLSDMTSPSRQGFHRPTKSLPTMTSPDVMFGTSPPVPVMSPPQGADKRSMRYTMSMEFRNDARQSSVILPRASMQSAYSTDSLEVVRNLASQFPGIPPRKAAGKANRPPTLPLTSPDERDEIVESPIDDAATLGRGLSVGSTQSGRSAGSQLTKGGSLVRRSSSVKRKPVPKAASVLEDGSDDATLVMRSAPVSRSNSLKDDQVQAQAQTNIPSVPMPPIPATPDSELPAYDVINMSTARPRTAPGNVTTFPAWQKVQHNRRGTLEFPWVARPGDVADEGEMVLAEARQSVAQLARVKSVGNAPKRTTPPTTQNTFYRESVIAEWHDLSDDIRQRKLSEISELLSKRASASAAMALSKAGGNNRDLELGDSFIDYR